jgi:hypothetical protein
MRKMPEMPEFFTKAVMQDIHNYNDTFVVRPPTDPRLLQTGC